MTAFEHEPDASQLIAESRRYLIVVDAFRAEGAAPTWAADEAVAGWRRQEPRARNESAEGARPRPAESRHKGG